MSNGNAEWLAQKQFEERNQNYRTVWDLYLKFYTVFLTVNIIGIGVVVQHVPQKQRLPIIAAFVIQNLLSAGTAYCIARFSKEASAELEEFCQQFAPESTVEILTKSPLPALLGFRAGWANVWSHMAFIICWVGLWWVPLAN
ncbi:MAG: hypothetical protein H6976_08800 [Gammaproteobacteria bacterium]|nr:hypothetical protein [Gammaproteobacteria bacterium]